MRGIALREHGFDPEAVPTPTLEDLQATACRVLEGMDQQHRISACGRVRVPHASPAAFGDSSDEAHYFTGVCRCENSWLCPVCAFSTQLETRLEVEAVMEKWMDDGGWVYMVTLTVPHSRVLELQETTEILLDAWTYLKSGNQWQEWSERIGYAGAVRTLEVTHGEANGWHPHIHAPFFLEGRPDPDVLAAFRQWAVDRLNKRIRSWYRNEDGELRRWPMNRNPPDWFAPCFRELHPDHGLQVTGGQNAASYIAKMGLSRELSGFMSKQGRMGHRTMFQVLLDCHVHNRKEDHRIFREYAREVTGKSRWHWTPGFRADVLGDTEEEEMMEDEKLMEEAERLSEKVMCFRVDAELWDALKEVVDGNLQTHLLDAYNSGGLDFLGHWMVSQFKYSTRDCTVHREPGSRLFTAQFYGPGS